MGAISDFVARVNAGRAGGDAGQPGGGGGNAIWRGATKEEREKFQNKIRDIIDDSPASAPGRRSRLHDEWENQRNQEQQSGWNPAAQANQSVLDIITGGPAQEPSALQQAITNTAGGSPFTTKTGINLGPGIDFSVVNPVRGAAEDTYNRAEADYNKAQEALKTTLQNAPGDIDYTTDPTINAARAAAKKAEDDLRVAREAYERTGGMGHSYSMEDRASDIVKGAAGSTAASDVDAVRAVWEKGENQREMRRAEEEATLADLDASVQRAQIRLDDLMRTTHGDTSNPAVQQAMERLRQEQDFRNRYVNATGGAFNVDKLNAVTGKATALADELAAGSAQNIARSKEGLGRIGRALVDAGVSGTQMLMDTAVSAMTGGMITPEMAMAMRSFGGGTMQARQGGGDIDQQLMYGGATATLEVLTEHMFDGVAGIYGKGAADDVVEDVIRRMTSSDIGRTALRKLFNAGGEGAEELISAAVTPIIDAIYNGKSVGENYSEMDVSESLYDGLVGFLVGLAGGGASYIAGQDAPKNAELRVQDAGLGNVSSQVDNALDVLQGRVTPEQQAQREANARRALGIPVLDVIQNGEVQQTAPEAQAPTSEVETPAAEPTPAQPNELAELREWANSLHRDETTGEMVDWTGFPVTEQEIREKSARLQELESMEAPAAEPAAQAVEAPAEEAAPETPTAPEAEEPVRNPVMDVIENGEVREEAPTPVAEETPTPAPAPVTEQAEQTPVEQLPSVNQNATAQEVQSQSNSIKGQAESYGLEYEPPSHISKPEFESLTNAINRASSDMNGEMQRLVAKDAWTGEDLDTALVINGKLLVDAIKNNDFEAVDAWLKVLEPHKSEAGRALQALGKWARGGRAVINDTQTALANSDLSPAERSAVMDKVIKFADRFDLIEDGDLAGIRQLILDLNDTRNTGTFFPKRFAKLLKKETDFNYLKEYALRQLMAVPNDSLVKPDLGQKLKTWQSLAQLMRITTMLRNEFGNESFGILDFIPQNTVGTWLDALVASVDGTGLRTVGMSSSWLDSDARKAMGKAINRSVMEIAGDVYMGGENAYNTQGPRTFKASDQNVLNRILSRAEQLSGYGLQTTDEATSARQETAYINMLERLNGEKMTDAQKEELAKNIAEYRTFKNNGIAKSFSQGAHDWLNRVGIGGEITANGRMRSGGFGLAEILGFNYPGVPANLGVKPLEYSPANVAKGVIELVKYGKDAQQSGKHNLSLRQQAVMDIARGVTGTVLISALTGLFKSGILKYYDDEDDYDVQQQNRAEGKAGTLVNLSAFDRMENGENAEWGPNDLVMNIGYLQPINSLMAVTHYLSKDAEDGLTAAEWANDFRKGSWNGLLDMPVMQSISSLADVLKTDYSSTDAEEYGGSKIVDALVSVGGNAASGMIPGFISQTAKATDTVDRDTSGDSAAERVFNAMKKSIPGLRETLPEKYDSLGNPITLDEDPYNRVMNALVRPGTISRLNQSEASQTINKVIEETGNKKVMPDSRAPAKIKIDGEDYELNAADKRMFRIENGGMVAELTDEAAQNGIFQNASPVVQGEILEAINAFAKDRAKAAVAGQYGEYKSNYQSLLDGKFGADGEVIKPPLDESNIGEYIMFDTALKNALKNRDYDSVESLFGNFQNLNANTQAVLAAGGNDVATYVGLVNGKGKEGDSDYVPPLAVENVGDWAEFHNAANAAINAEDFEEVGNLFGNFSGMNENLQEVLTARDDDVGRIATLVSGTKAPNPEKNIPALDAANLGEYLDFEDELKDATKNDDYGKIDDVLSQFLGLDTNTQEVLTRRNPAYMKDLLKFINAGSSSESYYNLRKEVGDAQWEMEASGKNAQVKLAGLANTDIPDEEKDALVSSGAFALSKTGKTTYEILRGIDMEPGDISQWFENADWYSKNAETEPSADGTLNPYEVAVAISKIPDLNDASRTALFNQFKLALQNPTNKQDAWKNKSYLKTLRSAFNNGRTVGKSGPVGNSTNTSNNPSRKKK